MLRYREADRSDSTTLEKLAAEAGGGMVFGLRAGWGERCIAAFDKGVAIGFAIFNRTFYGRNFVRLIFVHPKQRRRGVASRLLGRVESACTGSDLFISTNRSNVSMRRLLKKMGYRRSGYIENLDEGDPEIVYFKRL